MLYSRLIRSSYTNLAGCLHLELLEGFLGLGNYDLVTGHNHSPFRKYLYYRLASLFSRCSAKPSQMCRAKLVWLMEPDVSARLCYYYRRYCPQYEWQFIAEVAIRGESELTLPKLVWLCYALPIIQHSYNTSLCVIFHFHSKGINRKNEMYSFYLPWCFFVCTRPEYTASFLKTHG